MHLKFPLISGNRPGKNNGNFLGTSIHLGYLDFGKKKFEDGDLVESLRHVYLEKTNETFFKAVYNLRKVKI